MFTRKSLLPLVCLGILALLAAGCGASQDASKSISRAAINRGDIVPAESVRVNEYLNYYDQRFPEPVGQPLGLDVRLGNPQIPIAGGEVWVQVGLQARPATVTTRSPLNMTLVLDVSGSMADADKMSYLKQALMVFLQSLRSDDIVAIVVYSNDARVLRPAQPVGDGVWIAQTVASLKPEQATNLHNGLNLGFQEVDRNFDIRRNNRVILMTDGIANVGETDPARIAADALSYTQRGVYLSTIGLGSDVNDQLLSTLARQGNGAYHFIDSAQEIEKAFRKEAEGLVERVANDVNLNIRPLSGARLTGVTGFEGAPPAKGARVAMQEMGAGDSQVVIIRLDVPAGGAGSRPLAEITLDYTDVFAQRPRQIGQSATAQAVTMAAYDPLADIEVRRNATIVRSAEALKAIDGLFNQGRYLEAWQWARTMEQELRITAALAGDSQMVEDADLFRRYQITLTQALGYDPAIPSTPVPPATNAQPQRWGVAPTPGVAPLPTIEVR